MTQKLVLYAVAALLIALLAYKAYDAIGDAREAKVRAEYEKVFAKQEHDRLAAEAKQRADLNARSAEYEKQIADLRNLPAATIVRVPKCPAASPEPAALAGEPREAPPAGLDRENGQSSAAVQFSLGLREYAKDCQAVAIQLSEVIRAWP